MYLLEKIIVGSTVCIDVIIKVIPGIVVISLVKKTVSSLDNVSSKTSYSTVQ